LERSKEPLQKTTLDIHQVIQGAISHIQLILKDKSGVLNARLKAENCTVLGNKNHLTNIVVNLLDNAVKYSDKSPKVEIETLNEDNEFILKVKDNGIGMTPAVQKKVFDKFYRAASGDIHNVKGHGLGLAYVKKIVDLHKGQIYLESKNGIGTTFTLKIPNEN
jgi:two-component system phosphate regulon sensor histidine kinase PhoR